MQFEYGTQKSRANLLKHGIDFEDAQRLWEVPTVTFHTKPDSDEVHYLVLGMIDGKHWTAIITDHGEHTRIISIRRSRTQEEKDYERYIQGR